MIPLLLVRPYTVDLCVKCRLYLALVAALVDVLAALVPVCVIDVDGGGVLLLLLLCYYPCCCCSCCLVLCCVLVVHL